MEGEGALVVESGVGVEGDLALFLNEFLLVELHVLLLYSMVLSGEFLHEFVVVFSWIRGEMG